MLKSKVFCFIVKAKFLRRMRVLKIKIVVPIKITDESRGERKVFVY